MAIYVDSANNPTTWRLTDSVVIVEQPQPVPAAVTEGDGLVGIVGEFPWGPADELIKVNSSADLDQLFGQATDLEDWGGYKALTGKAWPAGGLYLVRAKASSGAVKAVRTVRDNGDTEDLFSVTAKYASAAGNQIEVLFTQVDANTFDLEVSWGDQTVVHEGLARATTAFDDVTNPWVDFAWLDADTSGALPATDGAAVALSTGANGTISDADWVGSSSSQKGLQVLRQMPDGGIVLAAEYTSAAWIAGLALHVLAKNCAGAAQADDGDVFADAITAAGGIANERIRLFAHRVTQFIEGTLVNVDLAPFYASVYAAIDPSESAAQAAWSSLYLSQIQGVVGDVLLERSYWIQADDAGAIMAERLSSGAFTFHMDITSDPANASSVRRRMHDYVNTVVGTRQEAFKNTKPTPGTIRRQATAVNGALRSMVVNEQIEEFSHLLVARDGSSTTWQTKVKLFGEQRYIINKTQVGAEVIIDEVQ